MRKFLLLMCGVLCFCFARAQNYTNLVNYAIRGTPVHGVKIKTNLPFTDGTQMPTIHIYGYNYNTGDVIDLSVAYYIYGGAFIHYSASSAGNYTPPLSLSDENGKVVLFINDKSYYQRFSISAFAYGMPADTVAANFQGWTAVDDSISGTNTVNVPYQNRFSGNVYLTNGIWNNSGKVGIGTNAPVYNLDANGVGRFTGEILAQGGVRVLGSVGNDIEANSPWYGLGMSTSLSNCVQLAGYYGLNLRTASGQLYMSNAGNVGIGTTTPATKLAVNGTVSAKEVNVTTTGWPDYVFKPGYHLLSLDSLSRQIKNEQHLPGIPSAIEIEKNGLNLAATNKLQQQKIEELTLYLIEEGRKAKKSEDRIQALEEQNCQQQTILVSLEQRVSALEKAGGTNQPATKN